MVVEGIGRSVIRRSPFNLLCGAGSINLVYKMQNGEVYI